MNEHDLDKFLYLINAATFSAKVSGEGHRFVLRDGKVEPFRPRQFGWLRGDLSGRHVFVSEPGVPMRVSNWTMHWSEGASAIELDFDINFEIECYGAHAAGRLAVALLSGVETAGTALHRMIARHLNRQLKVLLQQCEKRGESLHDCFLPTAAGMSQRRELDAEVGAAVSAELGVPFRVGFQMRDPAPRQIEVRCTNAFTLLDRNGSSEVVTTALLQFDNIQAHKRSGLHDEASIRAALERQVAEAVKELLFGKRYYAVARAFAADDNAIRADMAQRLEAFAKSIGYRIRLFSTLIDISALKLFHGLVVEVPAGDTYQLRSRGVVELSVSVQVEAGSDDEAMRRLVDANVTDPAEPIAGLVRRCCRETLAQFDYTAASVKFDVEVRPALEARIVEELAGFGLRATILRLRSEPTEDVMRFMELCRLPAIDFTVAASPQADGGHGDTIEVDGIIDIMDIAPDEMAWLRFQSGNFGYRRDSPRTLDDMRVQARRRGISDVDAKPRRALAVAIEVAEIRERVMATLRNGIAMQRDFARVWASAENAASIERWANELVASAIADEFGLRVQLRGFGRRDTLAASAAQAIRIARLRNDKEAAELIAQQEKRHDVQDHELMHQQRVARQQKLAEVEAAALGNTLDIDHATQRDRAEREIVAMSEHLRQREDQWHQPATSSSPPSWRPPPIPGTQAGAMLTGTGSPASALEQARPAAQDDSAARALPTSPQ
ncbi:hypothetical protein [Tahibacter sp.]|uniref:hypothetical protein n=1 Tax=Tahibacter sp. TaxID=2056211 RepID=UPI0028C42875|nr:hypothetical protein [Tahibacter sp.]